MDKYANYEELRRREREGIDYRIIARAGDPRVAVIAIHGGLIEHGCMEIADAVAGADYSYYCFEGTKKSGNLSLHIKSTHFDEPRGLGIVEKADAVIAVHGFSDKKDKREVVFIGGGDQALKKKIEEKLKEAGFAVEESRLPGLKGILPENICNRGRTGRGVQLEISAPLRKKMFHYPRRGSGKRKSTVFFKFTTALRDAIRILGVLS